VETHDGKQFLIIEDLFNSTQGDWLKTLTNNMENVVREISSWEQIDPGDFLIIYKDTDDDWSMYDAITDSFIPGILTKSKEQAIKQVLQRVRS
jgi:hypothetical protein